MAIARLTAEALRAMTPAEREQAIRNYQRQMDVIMFAQTLSADEKRAELQERIDYLRELERAVEGGG